MGTVNGVVGRIWQMISLPIRLAAPPANLAKRAVKAEFWIESEQTRHGTPAPSVELEERPDMQPPDEGAGPLNHRLYRVHITDAQRTAEDLIDAFRRRPNDFSPTSFATFDPPPGPPGLAPGDEVSVRLPGPWDGPVLVTRATDRSIRLETRNGHMEAGWIEFSAHGDADTLVFSIESLARSGDAAFDTLYHRAKIGKLVQTEMWVNVLESAVVVSGGTMIGRPAVHTTIYEEADK